jgi:multiple sugar transport system substrate-binding protein
MTELRGLTWRMQRGHAPLVAAAELFHQQHPEITITWEALPWGQFTAAQREALAGGTGAYDLIMFDQPWVGEYARRGWLVALDELMTPAERRDLADDADPASLACYRFDDRQWALPVDVACQSLTYRADLVAGLGTALPGDWDSLLAGVRALHHPPEQYPFAHSLGGVNAFLFVLSVAAALGEEPYAEQGQRLDPATGIRGLELLRAIWALSLPAAALGGRRAFECLLTSDRAALSPALFPYLSEYRLADGPALTMTDMPVMAETGRRTSALGGIGLGIASASRHRDAAWEYAWYLMSREIQGEIFPRHGGQPGRRSALYGPERARVYGEQGQTLAQMLTDCYIRPRRPGWYRVEHDAGDAILRYLDGKLTAQEAIGQMDAVVAAADTREAALGSRS